MLTTSIPLSAAYVSASTVGCRKKKPESCPARMFTSVTFGATPAIPSPFSAAPTDPATCVSCPSSSSFAGSTQLGCSHSPSSDGISVTKLRESAASKFGARSGCVPSMPVSRIPTRTPLSPGCFAYEPPTVAWIIAMSHWSPARGSADTATREAWAPPRLGRPQRGRTLRGGELLNGVDLWRQVRCLADGHIPCRADERCLQQKRPCFQGCRQLAQTDPVTADR